MVCESVTLGLHRADPATCSRTTTSLAPHMLRPAIVSTKPNKGRGGERFVLGPFFFFATRKKRGQGLAAEEACVFVWTCELASPTCLGTPLRENSMYSAKVPNSGIQFKRPSLALLCTDPCGQKALKWIRDCDWKGEEKEGGRGEKERTGWRTEKAKSRAHTHRQKNPESLAYPQLRHAHGALPNVICLAFSSAS